jgi:predicted flap endonuclease-1-like 5' DNA nuclease
MRFIMGMIIGLVVGWGIDFLRQWRRQDGKLPEPLEDVEAENRFLRTKLAEVEDALSKMPRSGGVRATERKIEQLQAELNVHSNQIPQRKDRLERIKGIGAVFARRFNDAGIFTFDQLAALTPEQIEEIVQVEGWQKIEPEQWIAEAKVLAQEVS